MITVGRCCGCDLCLDIQQKRHPARQSILHRLPLQKSCERGKGVSSGFPLTERGNVHPESKLVIQRMCFMRLYALVLPP